jgi:hypothetical protein
VRQAPDDEPVEDVRDVPRSEVLSEVPGDGVVAEQHGTARVRTVLGQGRAPGDPMTHAELIERSMRWLRNTRKHVVVLCEIGSDGQELPDVIGWRHRGACTVIECKVTRADFNRDRKKSFRMRGGMGNARFYATPPGLLLLHEVPPSWGLIEVGPKLTRVVKESGRFELERNTRGETACLISAVQRVTEGWGRKVFGEISPVHGQLDPHPTVAAAFKAYREENRSLRAKLARRDAQILKLVGGDEARAIQLVGDDP